jgi:hypothetical protein
VVCEDCRAWQSTAIATLQEIYNRLEKRVVQTHKVCSACTGSAPCEPIECLSLDCWWFYARKKAEHRAETANELIDSVKYVEDDMLRTAAKTRSLYEKMMKQQSLKISNERKSLAPDEQNNVVSEPIEVSAGDSEVLQT